MDRSLLEMFGGQAYTKRSWTHRQFTTLELTPPSSGHAHTGSKRILLQPHPQDLEPPATKRFQTLSSESLSKPSIPHNTKTATKLALYSFYSWMRHRNSKVNTDSDKCPETILDDMDPIILNKWLSAYIAETKKVSGDPYPPATLQALLSGLLHHMRSYKWIKSTQ